VVGLFCVAHFIPNGLYLAPPFPVVFAAALWCFPLSPGDQIVEGIEIRRETNRDPGNGAPKYDSLFHRNPLFAREYSSD
jgi:hypothetical protein